MNSFNRKISTSCSELSAQTQGGAGMAQNIFDWGMRIFRPCKTLEWILQGQTPLIQLLKMEKFSDYKVGSARDPDLLLQVKGRTGWYLLSPICLSDLDSEQCFLDVRVQCLPSHNLI